MRSGFGLCVVLVLLVSCGDKSPRVTRDQCAKVADHIADLIMEHYTAKPDELWDGMTVEPGDTGVPKSVTKETFKDFLATPEGKTWLMQRKGAVRSAAEAGVEPCVASATQKQVTCLLAAKSRDDVTACDQNK